jgi:hypothetical protein
MEPDLSRLFLIKDKLVEKLYRDAKCTQIYEDCKKGSRVCVAQALE